ncbi:uncharacterized protein LOC114173012 isoform X1 [Vigna unguiculata]|uniref:uncharacterized protein LOC114173012 isoform X1 n=1 Tax=Vigna unguiculata TaxID=3917 RepID=UPI0010160CE5|nr:uncharacterized protein LOC114173012 isoform X1 [Vigna unguiculata]
MPPLQLPPPARDDAVDASHHQRCRRREPRFFLLRARLLRRTSVANQDLPPPYQPPRSGHASAMEARTPAFVGVTPAPTHPNPCLSSSAREKGVVTPSTRHHRADHTATRFENVTRSRSTVDELRIAGLGYFGEFETRVFGVWCTVRDWLICGEKLGLRREEDDREYVNLRLSVWVLVFGCFAECCITATRE